VTQVGPLEGVFYSLDPGRNRLALTEVVLHPSGKKMEGFSHYYRSEVISVHDGKEENQLDATITVY
jgi:hypothetical protein